MSSEERVIRPHRGRADKIIAGFERDNNQWKTSNDIAVYLPGDKTTHRYNIISQMSSCKPPLLEKEPYQHGNNRYRLAPEYKQAYLSLFPSLPAIKALVNTISTEGVGEISRHVRWDDGEWTLMIEQVRELRRRMPGLVLLDAARKAQDILISQGLLAHTHKRPLSSQSTIQPIINALFNDDGTPRPDPADEPVHAEAAPVPEPEPEPTPEPSAAVAIPVQAAPQTIGQMIDAALPSILATMGASLSECIAKGVADGIAQGFARLQPIANPEPANVPREMGVAPPVEIPSPLLSQSAIAEVMANVTKPPKHNPEPEQGPRLPKVLILGLYPDEHAPFVKEFGGALDLRFWSPTDDTKALSNMLAGNPKRVFALWQRFKHRGHENLVTRCAVPYTRINGGVAQLQEAITAYYVESTL